jgi:BirA family biotin operon repressor/biotin-[acetyl-CoA-carboxylase] ligase
VQVNSTFWKIVETDETASTNADVVAAARAGAPHGTVHTTRHQSAGRGRLDRSFEMPAGTGMAVSILLRPTRPMADWPWIGLLTGLAVHDVVHDVGLHASLKWPNDVLVGDKKIAGILVELVDDAVVVGVGLNVTMTADQLPVPTATSLALEGVEGIEPQRLVPRFLAHLAQRYGMWDAGFEVIEEYRATCSTIGQQVRVMLPAGDLEGRAEDVDDEGRLVVDGTAVSAGDVTHLRPISG